MTRQEPSLRNLCASAPLRFSILLVLPLLLNACGDSLYKQQTDAFGTLAEVSIYGVEDSHARETADEILREFERLQRMLDPIKPGELSSLNAAFAKQPPASLGPEMARIIKDTTALSEKSAGSFNPAIGKLNALWGFHAEHLQPVIPAAGAIDALVSAMPRMTDITLDGNRASSHNPAAQLDFDGYARGYALDRARVLLQARGIRHALINIGGTILAIGEHGTRPWKAGIQHPRREGPIATIELYDGETLATAGDYPRYFEKDGRRYGAIIDPATGYPVQGVAAATVITAPGEHMGALADAASRSIFVSGVAGWRAAAQRMNVPLAMLIDDRGEVYLTAALARRIEFKPPKPVIHEIR